MGGIEFDGSELANIRIEKSVQAPGLHGVSTSAISFDVLTDVEFDENTSVITALGIELPTFYISSAPRRGKVVSVTAYDRCGSLDRVFDISGLEDDVVYSGSDIIGRIASQCGFAAGSLLSVAKAVRADLEGKSCRNILEELAKADMSVAFCRSDNTIGYAPAESENGGIVLSESSSAVFEISSPRNIELLIVENDKTSECFNIGSGDYLHAYQMSGVFMSAEICSGIGAKIFREGGKFSYSAWSCRKAVIDANIDVGGGVYLGERHCKALDIRISCGAKAIYAAVSAPSFEMSQTEYSDKMTRKVNNKLEIGKKYGCTRINRNKGYTLVDDDEGQKEYSMISLGDGLFQNGVTGDIECKLECVGTDVSKPCETVYDYGKYTVTVGWTEAEKGVRTDPWFRRDYKS